MEAASKNTWKRALLRVIAVYILLVGTLSLFGYFAREYLPFIAYDKSFSTYVPTALRMTFRLAYPVAAIAIFLLRTWGVWLLVIVWFVQLVPSSIYALASSRNISGQLGSFIQFIIIIGLIYGCRSVLKSGKTLKPLLIFLTTALALHSVFFFAAPEISGEVNIEGRSELLGAVRNNDEAAVKKCLGDPAIVQKELNPKCSPHTRCKPISFAAESGNLDILKMLLDAGADPNGATSYGDTPLIIAIMSNRKGVIDLLLQYKADVNRINQFGASAFTGAAAMGDAGLVIKFLQHGANVNQTFPYANPSTKKVQGNTSPLSVAVQRGYVDVVKLLMENKADPDIKDSFGKSAVDYAKESGNAEIRKLLGGS